LPLTQSNERAAACGGRAVRGQSYCYARPRRTSLRRVGVAGRIGAGADGGVCAGRQAGRLGPVRGGGVHLEPVEFVADSFGADVGAGEFMAAAVRSVEPALGAVDLEAPAWTAAGWVRPGGGPSGGVGRAGRRSRRHRARLGGGQVEMVRQPCAGDRARGPGRGRCRGSGFWRRRPWAGSRWTGPRPMRWPLKVRRSCGRRPNGLWSFVMVSKR